jgi:uncharacterized OsmC-like protein
LLTARARGEVEEADGVLVLRRIHVHYTIRGEGIDPEVVERVHDLHASKCPVALSIGEAVDITTSYELAAGSTTTAR